MTDKEDEQNKPRKNRQHANKKNIKIIKNNVPTKLDK